MAVNIIKEPDIYITQEEHDRYYQEWQQQNMFTTAPVSFETFVRRKKNRSGGNDVPQY